MIARYEAIETILEYVAADDLVLSTTGMISREVFTIRDRPGNFYMIGSMGRPGNLVHIVLDNEAYESTGAQPSISSKVDLGDVAKSCGYARVARVDGTEGLGQALLECTLGEGPFLILVKVGIAPIEGIPRVSHSPTDIRDRFRDSLQRGG